MIPPIVLLFESDGQYHLDMYEILSSCCGDFKSSVQLSLRSVPTSVSTSTRDQIEIRDMMNNVEIQKDHAGGCDSGTLVPRRSALRHKSWHVLA